MVYYSVGNNIDLVKMAGQVTKLVEKAYQTYIRSKVHMVFASIILKTGKYNKIHNT